MRKHLIIAFLGLIAIGMAMDGVNSILKMPVQGTLVSEVLSAAAEVTDKGVITVSARGLVNSGGWANAALVPAVYRTPPGDGIMDIRFVAEPPLPSMGSTQALENKNAYVNIPAHDWYRGFRIQSKSNSVIVMIETHEQISVLINYQVN